MTTDRPLRIHHVVTDIHRQDAGSSYAVMRLSEELGKLHQEVHIHTLEPPLQHPPEVRIYSYRPIAGLRSLGVSEQMRQSLRVVARSADIMHSHGLWRMPAIYPAWATQDSTCKLVKSPHGMLEPWAVAWRAKRKRAFGIALQDRALSCVDAFHATSTAEVQSIRSSSQSAPIAVVPVGIDVPEPREPTLRPYRQALYLGRLHPKKNVETLIDGWGRVASEHPNWRLVVAGPGNANYVRSLKERANSIARITFKDGVYGQSKDRLFRTSDLFVMPTFSENFGITVAEALSYSMPVISTTGSPWQGLEARGCGWWVSPTIEGIEDALREALKTPDTQRERMGQIGRQWMIEEFDWRQIAKRMLHFYQWLVGLSDVPPSCVHA